MMKQESPAQELGGPGPPEKHTDWERNRHKREKPFPMRLNVAA